MEFDKRHYVPCIRWKQGEYQALLHLSSAAKDLITPLIEVPEIGFDFEVGAMVKSIDQHMAPQAKRIKAKWGDRQCFVDVKLICPSSLMNDGRHPVTFVSDELRDKKCLAIPVTGLDRSEEHQNAVGQVVSADNRGMCLRLNIEEAAKKDVKSRINALLERLHLRVNNCHLVIDLGAPNFVPVDGFAKAVYKLILELPYLSQWLTFTILGTSFPRSMAEVKPGLDVIRRSEWLLYKDLAVRLTKTLARVPTFGDYAVNHPSIPELDWRITKPFATIRYTIDDAWLIIKGRNIRDYGLGQYKHLCRLLMASGYYLGTHFSEGDRHISDCAGGLVGTGNLTTWRRVGTNHHLEKVAKDVSNLFCS